MVITCTGEVVGLVVPGERKAIRAIASGESLFIPWKCITKIGEGKL